jgi:hypothetical protein
MELHAGGKHMIPKETLRTMHISTYGLPLSENIIVIVLQSNGCQVSSVT